MSKQETKKTEIEVKKSGAVAIPEELMGDWGAAKNVFQEDIKIPRLLVLQNTSDLVADRVGQPGDIIKNGTYESVAKHGSELEFLPICFSKTWLISKKIGNKYEFQYSEPFTASNKNMEWSFEHEGALWRRDQSLSFVILLVQDISAELEARKAILEGKIPNLDAALMPIGLTFRRTSYDAGRDLITYFKKAEHFGVSAAINTYKVKTELVKGDAASYYVMKISKGRDSSKDELMIAKSWFDKLQTSKVIIDETGDEKVQEKQAAAQANAPLTEKEMGSMF